MEVGLRQALSPVLFALMDRLVGQGCPWSMMSCVNDQEPSGTVSLEGGETKKEEDFRDSGSSPE